MGTGTQSDTELKTPDMRLLRELRGRHVLTERTYSSPKIETIKRNQSERKSTVTEMNTLLGISIGLEEAEI